MFLALKIPLLVLNICNVILHSAGIALLISISKANKRSPKRIECKQHIFLLNLSIAEGLFNLFEVIRIILYCLNSSETRTIQTIRQYLLIVNFTAIWVQVWIVLFGMTIDRLLNIILELKYPTYWDKSKSKNYLLIGWCVSGCIGVSIATAWHLSAFPWERIFFLYVYPIIDTAFIVLAITTYALIYKKYKDSQKFCLASVVHHSMSPFTITNNKTLDYLATKKACSFMSFLQTRFCIPIMMVLTFLLFITVPDLIYLILGVDRDLKKRNVVLAGCWISYAVGNIADVIIYVFLQPNVRQYFTDVVTRLQMRFRKPTGCLFEEFDGNQQESV